MSESFQTSNAVDVSYSNAVTGTKEIQFLGLRGLYTQFLIENRTAFDGILSTMGYDLIPGTWLDQVNILKVLHLHCMVLKVWLVQSMYSLKT